MVPSVYYNYFYNVLLGSISKLTAIFCQYQIPPGCVDCRIYNVDVIAVSHLFLLKAKNFE